MGKLNKKNLTIQELKQLQKRAIALGIAGSILGTVIGLAAAPVLTAIGASAEIAALLYFSTVTGKCVASGIGSLVGGIVASGKSALEYFNKNKEFEQEESEEQQN